MRQQEVSGCCGARCGNYHGGSSYRCIQTKPERRLRRVVAQAARRAQLQKDREKREALKASQQASQQASRIAAASSQKAGGGGGGGGGGATAAAQQRGRTPFSNAAAAALLTAIGFGAEQAAQSLRTTGGDIRATVRQLLRDGGGGLGAATPARSGSPAPPPQLPGGAADADGAWWEVGDVEREAHNVLLALAKERRQSFKERRRQIFAESRDAVLRDDPTVRAH
jgi:hypothetical protein